MAINQTVSCDECSADVTTGNGRTWRLLLRGDTIAMRPDTKPLRDAAPAPGAFHFCDEKCLADWAAKISAAKLIAQQKFEEAAAAALAAEQAAAPKVVSE